MSEGFTEDDLIEIIRLNNQERLSSRAIAEIMDCGKTTITDFLSRKTYANFWEKFQSDKPLAAGEKVPPETKRHKFTNKTFVITSAQNNTFVHDGFLQALHNYCDEKDAQLLISRFTYNKSGFQRSEKNDSELWYDPKVRSYLWDKPSQIAEGLVLCAELNVLPTAVNPLSGFQNYSGLESAIIPHTKMQMESVATPKYHDPKFLYTTGAVTQRNYIQKKSGQKAEFHHVFGALVVEVDGEGDWFVRQLIAESESGNFYDLDRYYTAKGVVECSAVEAINWGDIHVAKLNQAVADVSWRNEDSMLDTLKPTYQFIHDVFDHKYRNHHNTGNPHFMFEMYSRGTESVESEVKQTAVELAKMERPTTQSIVVESNHDLALERWLREADYRRDPVNAVYFLRLQFRKYQAIASLNKRFKIFEFAVREFADLTNTQFLGTDESFVVCDIECGQHGHNGNNGSRGSVKAFQLQGCKFNTGHTHSAGIKDGVFTAGVSGDLDMGYNSGGSSWSHSHILTYKNGKRAIITLKESVGKMKWRRTSEN